MITAKELVMKMGLAVLAVVVSGVLLGSHTGARAIQAKEYTLESATGLRMRDLTAEPATLQGKKGLRITMPEATLRKLMGTGGDLEQIALLDGLEFDNGTIEAEIAGAPAPWAGDAARGFVGIAFRVQNDTKTFDAFYLRPTNGRADDQERRNHATQYISHPDWTWSRLRQETPSRYESYVDLVPDAWTKVKIEVNGVRARLSVGSQPQPVLIVNDLKTGARGKGAVGLWVGSGTIAHFRALKVQRLQ